ncbi:MAG: M23 family metallopeptidase [Polyangiaceae bacterium]
MTSRSLAVKEIFGLSPWSKSLREASLALRGDRFTPKSRFGVSSLHILRPRLSLETWAGRARRDGLIPIYNLFNHTQTAAERGWSVKVTQVRDFRGGRLTYDSHNGTDFAVPVGTVVVAAAPGRVARVSSEFNRGGLKVLIDHGEGLLTSSNHLGRALVQCGDMVQRGQPIALSGASGIDMLLMFPWSVPHVHFNVWLDGELVDPFAMEGQVSLWQNGNAPVPGNGPNLSDEYITPTQFDETAVESAIDACLDERLQRELIHSSEPGVDVLFHYNVSPTRFARRPRLVRVETPRRPRLDLPFRAEDFRGIFLPPVEGTANA